MTTVGDVVDRCLNTWLLGTYSTQFNALSDDITDSELEFRCALPLTEIASGSFIAVDNELMYVVERDATNNRITVVRGVRGTTAAAHLAGAGVEVNPRFPRLAIRNTIREEIDSLPDSVYKPKTITLAVASTAGRILVPTDIDGFTVRDVVRVRRQSLNTFDDRLRRTAGYETTGDQDTGLVIALAEDIGVATSFDVTCACTFGADSDLGALDDTTTLESLGMWNSLAEVLELGASYRLLMGRASARLFPEAQGQSRTAQEVGARDIPAFGNSILALHERALASEALRLYRRYGFGGK